MRVDFLICEGTARPLFKISYRTVIHILFIHVRFSPIIFLAIIFFQTSIILVSLPNAYNLSNSIHFHVWHHSDVPYDRSMCVLSILRCCFILLIHCYSTIHLVKYNSILSSHWFNLYYSTHNSHSINKLTPYSWLTLNGGSQVIVFWESQPSIPISKSLIYNVGIYWNCCNNKY